MRGQMPDRRALFDIGVAGPLAGLTATVIVTVIGLTQSPIQIPARAMEQSGQMIIFNNPPLLDIIATVIGEPTAYNDPRMSVSPIIIGGWVGMFFTVLNLLPVGQLDGGHILRAMLGTTQERVAALVPVSLIALSAYLHYGLGYAFNESVGLWAFWGVLSAFVAFKGPANPIDDAPLGIPRVLLGVLTFVSCLSRLKSQQSVRYTTKRSAKCEVQSAVIESDKPLLVQPHSYPSCGYRTDRDQTNSIEVQRLGSEEL
jgi:Zn-dependent protease